MDVFSEAKTNQPPIRHIDDEVHHDHDAAGSSTLAQPTVHNPDDFERVVAIAVDTSLYAEHAVNWAIANFLKHSDLVVLLNARPFVTPPGTIYMDVANYIDQQEAYQRSESHKLLRAYASLLKRHKFATKAIALKGESKCFHAALCSTFDNYAHCFFAGDVQDEIVRKVKEVNADILIIGSRGLGFLSRALVGSVSDYAVHQAHCPVLVVKPRPSDLAELKAKAERIASQATEEGAENVATRANAVEGETVTSI
ncbi:hypothetical protein BC830DRAFT_1106241 [Chytriomyces sp. MP71]|nr:hypothetical protein BC830DRAFT_1106241 [Chytriomyces sp. MP71]